MFERLQKKWKVNGLQLTLILCTFAIGGSLTGYFGRRLMSLLPVEKGWLWVLIYIIVITLIWPLAVLVVSIFFGQFSFFIRYLEKIGHRMGIGNPAAATRHIAIFASGAGSNAEQIIRYFKDVTARGVKVALIVTNKSNAGVVSVARQHNIPVLVIERGRFLEGDAYLAELKKHNISFIVLAGFLWKIPMALIGAYPGKIINIHPALLPKYGGKGMYGGYVHQSVLDNKDAESGITIHYVDEVYDHGAIIFQATCAVQPGDTPQSLAQRIHELEHEHYPRVIEQVLQQSREN